MEVGWNERVVFAHQLQPNVLCMEVVVAVLCPRPCPRRLRHLVLVAALNLIQASVRTELVSALYCRPAVVLPVVVELRPVVVAAILRPSLFEEPVKHPMHQEVAQRQAEMDEKRLHAETCLNHDST